MTRDKLTAFEKEIGMKAAFRAKFGRATICKERDGYKVRWFWRSESMQCDPALTRKTAKYSHALIVAEYMAKDHD